MMKYMCSIFFRNSGIFRMAAVLLAIMALPAGIFAASPEPAQRLFSSPEEARQALIKAVRAKDHAELKMIFGPVSSELEPSDPVEQATEFEHFASHVEEGVGIFNEGKTKAILVIGKKKWPFPVPIVKKNDKWMFDTASGREEIVDRRIGRNELIAVQVCRAYADAQREYYSMADQDGDQIPKYAQHMISRPGKRDGLYWPTVNGEKESPLGLLVAKAKEEGYMQPRKVGNMVPVRTTATISGYSRARGPMPRAESSIT